MYTRQELEAKTGPQLVEIFNSIQDQSPNGKRIQKFSSRGAGINRILTVQGVEPLDPEVVSDMLPPHDEIVENNLKAEADSVLLKRGRKPLPRGEYNLEGGPDKRPYRQNSGRGRLLAILTTTGATFEELVPQFPEWDRDQVHNTIRMTARWLGFNITTDDNGVIRASR